MTADASRPKPGRGPVRRRWTVRKAQIADADALADCMRAAYTPYGPRLGDGVLPPLTVDYADEIRACPVWVAESAGRLAGGLVLMFDKDSMTVANLAVHPRFQGNGLGRELMALAETEAKRRGYKTLRLATHVALSENLAYYARLGWSETGRDDSRVYMQKNIADVD